MQIKDIQANKPVNGRFMITDNQLRAAKNGTNYLAMKIMDSTGELAVKVWDASEELFQQMSAGTVIELENVTPKTFKDQVQLEWDSKNINVCHIVSEQDIDYGAFLPHAPGELAVYWDRLFKAIESITDPSLKKVLQFFFEDKAFVAHFLRVPGALKRHHAYIGGLVEHTVGVVNLCEAAAGYYPNVNRELLLTGAILHDIGKTRTYRIAKGFDGTNEGKLIGHLILGVEMVEQSIATMLGPEIDPDYRESLRNNLIHLLVSHHGILEWGSPVEPLTLEACILHHADNMDADTTKFLTIIKGQDCTTEWAPYDNGLGRSIYLNNLSPKVERKISEGV
ncbi:MAG TPA: HD domain-containing protein [Bacillota bacterium]|nr:HD domain-containing protein [Bacillota bacterium]